MSTIPMNEKEIKVRKIRRGIERKIDSNSNEIKENETLAIFGIIAVPIFTAIFGALTYAAASEYGFNLLEFLQTSPMPLEELSSFSKIFELTFTAAIPLIGGIIDAGFIDGVKEDLERITQLKDANTHLENKLTSEGRHM